MEKAAKVTTLIAKWKLKVARKTSVVNIDSNECGDNHSTKEIEEKVHHQSFTRQLAFTDAPNGHPTSSFYSDYRSNSLAKIAVAVILAVTTLLFIIFALKNRRLDAIIQAQFERMDEEERVAQLQAEAIRLNLTTAATADNRIA